MISLLQHARGCSTSGKPTCLCAEANERVTHCIDVICIQHYLCEEYLEKLIQISESKPKWRPFRDREAACRMFMS